MSKDILGSTSNVKTPETLALEVQQQNNNSLSGNLNLKSSLGSKLALDAALNQKSGAAVAEVKIAQSQEQSKNVIPKEVPFIETYGAALLDTPLGNYTARIVNGEYLTDEENPNFNAYPSIKGTEYEQHWEKFLNANGPADVQKLKSQIDREEEVRDTMAASSLPAQLLAGALTFPLDPVNLIPVGGTAYKVSKAGRFFAGAAKVGAVGALSSAVSEAALQSSQITRTPEESIANIAGSTLLAGLLGGAGSLLSKGDFNKMADSLEKQIQDEGPDFFYNEKGDLVRQGDSLSAASTPLPEYLKTSSADESVYAGPGGLAGAANFATAKLSPIQRVLSSDSVIAKRTIQDLVRVNLYTNKNVNGGIANNQSIEVALHKYDNGLATAISEGRGYLKQFSDNILAQEGKNKFTSAFNVKETLLRRENFMTKVYDALISGDSHPIPEIEATAKSYRKNVFDPMRKEAIDAGLLDEDVSVENATSYLMIQYDKNKIVAQEPAFKNLITSEVKNSLIPSIQREHTSRQTALTNKSQENFQRIKVLEDELARVKQANAASQVAKGKAARRADTLFKSAAGDTALQDADLIRILDSYKAATKAIREETKPLNLTDFIKSRGGIYDKSGRINSIFSERKRKSNGITAKKKLSEVNGEKINSDMKSIIDAAWREGYFPDYDAPPKTGEFLDALADEVDSIDVRYTAKDLDKVDRIEQAKEFLNQAGDVGIDFGKIKDAKTLRETKVAGRSFKDILIEKEISLLKKRTEEINGKIRDRRIRYEGLVGEDPSAYADEIADSIVRKIRNIEQKGVTMPYNMKIGVRGPAKERTLNFISQANLKPWLVQDVEKLSKDYTRVLGTDVQLQSKFGDLNLEQIQANISDEYDILRGKATTEKERLRLDKQEADVKSDLTAVKNIIRGDYGRVDRPDSFLPTFARVTRNVNYLTKMGSVTLASLVDPFNIVLKHGIGRTFGVGIKALIGNTKGYKAAAKDTRFVGNAAETILHSRTNLMGELSNPYSTKSSFENFVGYLSSNYSKINLLGQWTDFAKRLSSVVSQQRISKEVGNLVSGNISKNNRSYLALLGIDDRNAEAVANQIKQFSRKEGDLTVLDLENWKDKEAAAVFANALNLDIDRTIVTRGIGEMPLLLSTEIGKTIFQFKSFLLAANQQVTIASLQQADAAVVSGVMSLITAGMLVYVLQTKAKGEELSDNPADWIIEGFDRSGLAPIFFEINGYAEIMGAGARNATGAREANPNPGKAIVSRIGGPTVSSIVDAGDTVVATGNKIFGDGEFTENDQRKAIKMLPYNNLFYLRASFELLENALEK